jgi:hypothetical protein
MVEEVRGGRVRHFGQESLTEAFLAVNRVQMGGKWKFGRRSDDEDITPAQAATLALRFYDSQPRVALGAVESVAV